MTTPLVEDVAADPDPESTQPLWKQWLRRAWIPGLLFLLAVIIRLWMIHAQGGLSQAYLNPDEGAYFGATLGLSDGLMPYRDFLLLHPPGITVLLAPFGMISHVIGEHDAFMAMRVFVVLVGGINTVLAYKVASRVGTTAAILAGAFYAVWFPAARVERTSLMEPFVLTAILVALLVVGRKNPSYRWVVIGGAIAGILATVKLWAWIPLLIIMIAAVIMIGWRKAAAFAGATIGAAALLCLPFFIAAPNQMIRMVLLDQAQRSGATNFWARIHDIFAMGSIDPHHHGLTILVFAGVVVMAVVAVIFIPQSRLWAILLVVQIGVLMNTPSLFINYTAYTAAALALVIGAFGQAVANQVLKLDYEPRRIVSAILATVAVLIILPMGIRTARVLHPIKFPVTQVSAAIAGGKCITSDSAFTLIETNTFNSNVANGCAVVVDFTGMVYETRNLPLQRQHNPQFQQDAIAYLNQGDRVILMRQDKDKLSPAVLAELAKRPVLFHQGPYIVYGPLPAQ